MTTSEMTIASDTFPALAARRCAKVAKGLCHGQSIAAVSKGDSFRAIRFRTHKGELQAVDLHGGMREWLTVDRSSDGKPMIYDENGLSLI